MFATLFFVVALASVVSSKDHAEVNKLAKAVLESGAFPSITNQTAAKQFASLLIGEYSNYKKSVAKAGVRLPIQAFECNLTGRSNPRPTDAQKLRPADIDVVATIGDSIAAGFGALAGSIFSVFTEWRGYSFSIGGETAFDQFVTIPNILKLYNPNVKGFAVGNGGQTSGNAKLNVAVSGARSYDLPGQLDYLHQKMSAEVNMAEDWKLLSIFIGGNDLCDYCSDTTKNSPDNFRKNLEFILDNIKLRFPRIFVNLISPPDVTLLGQVSSGFCSLLHAYECGCAGDANTHVAHREYTQKLIELVASPKYHDKVDFHVSLQPFMSDMTLPMSGGEPDRSYFAPDCFHFSGKAHEAAGVALWNNMVEVTDKKVSWVPGEPLECPDEYLA